MASINFRVVTITKHHVTAFLLVCAAVAVMWSQPPDRFVRPVTGQPHAISSVPMDQPVRQVPGAPGSIALTINVDWGNDELLHMLDLLDEHEVKATFFPTGRWATNFPELVREIAGRGHEIGSHGLTHDRPTQISAERLHHMIDQGRQVLEDIIGDSIAPLFAPPYGDQNERVVAAAASLGMWTTLWTYDTIDWQDPSPEVIYNRIVPRAEAGGIVLMHPKPQTVRALPTMIEDLRKKGLEPVPLWHMMQQSVGGAR